MHRKKKPGIKKINLLNTRDKKSRCNNNYNSKRKLKDITQALSELKWTRTTRREVMLYGMLETVQDYGRIVAM